MKLLPFYPVKGDNPIWINSDYIISVQLGGSETEPWLTVQVIGNLSYDFNNTEPKETMNYLKERKHT